MSRDGGFLMESGTSLNGQTIYLSKANMLKDFG